MSPKIIFTINKDHDTKNWLRVSRMKNLPYGLTKHKIISKKIKDYTNDDIRKLEIRKKRLEEYFKKNGNIIFSSIEKLTQKPIYISTFYASFTTAGLIPYDTRYNWFMVLASKNIKKQISIIIHELLHLQIEHYYIDYYLQKKLKKYQFFELNEILVSIISDPILNNLGLPEDIGYQKHKNISIQLKKKWQENKNFIELLNKAIKFIKQK